MAMVELEPIADDEIENEAIYHQAFDLLAHGKVKIVGDLTKFDSARLRHLIERHVGFTQSSRGKAVLDDWRNALSKFRKVIPVEYREAMQKLAVTETQILETAGA